MICGKMTQVLESWSVGVLKSWVTPVPCHSHALLWTDSEVSEAQDPDLVVPVLVNHDELIPIFPPVELLSCATVNLTPQLTVLD